MGEVESRDSGPPGEESVLTHIPVNNIKYGQPTPQQYSWEMIGLGLEEPLPTADATNEL